MINQAWEILLRENPEKPELFVREGRLVRLVEGDSSLVITEETPDSFYGRLIRSISTTSSVPLSTSAMGAMTIPPP